MWKTHRMRAQTAMWYLDTNLSHITLCLFVCFIGGFEKFNTYGPYDSINQLTQV